MKHLPPRVVLDARHYHALGVTVAELARLYGVRRDTLSRAVSGATHAALVDSRPDSARASCRSAGISPASSWPPGTTLATASPWPSSPACTVSGATP